MSRFCAVLALVLLCSQGAWADSPSSSTPDDGWNGVIADLQSVSDDMAANQKQIDDLQAKISQLQGLSKDSAAEITRMQALVDAHAARVKQLGERYGKVLTLAQKLKLDVERASVLNYVFGTTAVVAIIFGVGEGFVLAHH